MPIYIVRNKITHPWLNCFYFKEEITAETLAMMSRMSQMGMIVNVERTSRIRTNYDEQNGGGGQEFAQLLQQETERLNKAETNGVEDAGTIDLVENRLDGKMNVYNNQGTINYFRMMTSMTDLRG